ncbi:MAG TPA: alpha/beta hydrolase [Nocardioidaceae bacterium]|nr:alpha/beta hydrolase [Nocardioidaceae bacterium]
MATTASGALPVVLLHAFPLSRAMWQAQHAGLAEAAGIDLELVTPDLVGFGDMPPTQEPPDLAWMAETVMRMLDQRGLRKVVLGGLSMGGYVAMEILRRRPSVAAALVLADTKASADPEPARQNRERIASLLEEREDPQVLVEEVLPALVSDHSRRTYPKVVDQVRELIEQVDPAAAAWAQRAMALRPDSTQTLATADVPALVVVGSQDQLSPVSEAEGMCTVLPQGRLEVVNGAGHLSAVEAPAVFNRVVGDFLRAL